MQHKIAVLSDVHGNVSALEAVLTDAKIQQATDYWFLGDLFLPGPGRSDLLTMLRAVHPSVWLRGNWERLIFRLADGQIDRDNPVDIYLARLSEYLLADLSAADFAWLKTLLIATDVVCEGVAIGLTHSQRDQDNSQTIFPARAQAGFDRLFIPNQDIALYGHSHTQIMRTSSAGQLVINPGSVGQPYSSWPRFMRDPGAQYALLEIDDLGRVQVDFRRVAYDVEKELQVAKERELPYFDVYKHLRETGEPANHNPELLAPINREFGYTAEVVRYFELS
ncbi:metallophosphoesterase family protein [Lacticaseibacillus saniviri]|uniref:Calcineurin-like phosphoesterase domain-containing protein n=3 Tax=Lacticaseibacillus saniviri TaxID=931533 RepID=A0A0R2MZ17_9LACO|nr:metallophosphoesterase family protein [Lacticaseibacillus saniviri]KRO18092.1 hypothetical protein IV56_GL001889 [Lacticaseibacillus saniviri JCM 17471 = DSM 24301]